MTERLQLAVLANDAIGDMMKGTGTIIQPCATIAEGGQITLCPSATTTGCNDKYLGEGPSYEPGMQGIVCPKQKGPLEMGSEVVLINNSSVRS